MHSAPRADYHNYIRCQVSSKSTTAKLRYGDNRWKMNPRLLIRVAVKIVFVQPATPKFRLNLCIIDIIGTDVVLSLRSLTFRCVKD